MARGRKASDSQDVAPVDNKNFLKKLAHNLGGSMLSDERKGLEKGFIDTANLALNYICSGKAMHGGIPMGRVTEIHGPSSAGKTALATHMIQGCQRQGGITILIDSENAYSPSFSEKIGINTEELIYLRPQTLEGCFSKIVEIVNQMKQDSSLANNPTLIVYDSIAASPSDKEFNEAVEGKEHKAETGNRAKICSRELRIISQLLIDNNIALVVINQLRTDIGKMFGNPETRAGGGKSLEYYCSTVLDVRRRKEIKRPPIEKAFGVFLDVKTKKNKIHEPYWEAKNLQLFFAEGLDPLSGFVEAGLYTGLFTNPSKGWIAPTEEPTNTFRAKDIEAWLLTGENYRFANAENRDELQKFIDMNRVARIASEGDYQTVDVQDEDDSYDLPIPDDIVGNDE